MSLFDFQSVFESLQSSGHAEWLSQLRGACDTAICPDAHGKLAEWRQTVEEFRPGTSSEQAGFRIQEGRLCVGEPSLYEGNDLRQSLMQLHPWRKGPLEICGQSIDTEWRSDWKWDRVCDVVELRDRRVLDIGCGNGYFGYRMLEAGAREVIGIDPFLLFVMQHELIRKLTGQTSSYVLPVSDQLLNRTLKAFDVAFSMGVLYHRTSPIDHLQVLAGSIRPGGQAVLETLVIDDRSETVLVPQGRYAMMRNVWFLPSLSMLKLWMTRTGFQNIKVVDVSATTTSEQRSTEWMTFDSLPDFLAPDDPTRTIEGYPAPLRAMVHATVR